MDTYILLVLRFTFVYTFDSFALHAVLAASRLCLDLGRFGSSARSLDACWLHGISSVAERRLHSAADDEVRARGLNSLLR